MYKRQELRSDVAGVVRGKCPGIRHVVSMQARETVGDVLSLSRLIAGHAGTYETELAGGQLCTILFTSGTTGKSKGVMLSHRNLTDNAVCLDMRIPAGKMCIRDSCVYDIVLGGKIVIDTSFSDTGFLGNITDLSLIHICKQIMKHYILP